MYLTKYNTFLANAGMLVNLVGICLLAIVASCNCLQCYECGVGENLKSCEDFNPSNLKFIRDCPPGSKSCSTETDANSVSKTCEDRLANACKVFSGVEYCYCSQDLCNGVTKTRANVPNDDEDFEEGSGTEDPRERRLPQTTIAPTNSPSNAEIANKFCFTFALICCFSLLI